MVRHRVVQQLAAETLQRRVATTGRIQRRRQRALAPAAIHGAPVAQPVARRAAVSRPTRNRLARATARGRTIKTISIESVGRATLPASILCPVLPFAVHYSMLSHIFNACCIHTALINVLKFSISNFHRQVTCNVLIYDHFACSLPYCSLEDSLSTPWHKVMQA